MNFFEALNILEKDLKTHLGVELPRQTCSGVQFVNIMQEFINNYESISNNIGNVLKTPEQFITSIWILMPDDKYVTKKHVFEAMREYGKYVKEFIKKK